MIDFPPYRLDPDDEVLWRDGVPVHLRPKSFRVLLYLVERPGHLVTTDELLDAVWPGVVASGETLTQVIAEVRRALGDHARHPSFIQTVHRRGFRFIAEVQPSAGGDRISPSAAPSPRAHRESQELPGREAELAHLGELLVDARAGRRQLVFVTGEPGIGKTRLVRSFLQQLPGALEDEPVWIAEGKCVYLHGEGEAYLPVLEALERLVSEAGAQRVVRTLARFAPSWLAQLPWLLETDELSKLRESTSGSTPTRMVREFCLAMEALSTERTLVLWLEDLHWSDTATIDLLAALAARSDPARLLVLASYRPVDAAIDSHPVAPLKRSLAEQRRCEEISLGLLDEKAVGAILRLRFAAKPDEALAALIYELTEGNPLYVVTLVDYFVAERLVKETKAGWKASGSPEVLRAAAPEGIGTLVETQLARLTDEELELLQAGSVSGETFAAQSVASATGLDIDVAEKVCGRLAGSECFVEAAGPSSWPDGSAGERYRFQHAVFRHVIYRGLPAGLRQRLHHRVGERLEDGFGSESAAVAAELALHFERGGDPERAVQHLVAAAAGVRQRAGDREAVAYFEHALALLALLPESAERDQRELELRLSLWRELNASGATSAVEQNVSLERALELSGRTGDERSGAYASSYLTRSMIMGCALDEAEVVEEQRVKLVSRLGDPILSAASHSEIGDIALYRGELDRANRELALCLSELEGVDPLETCRILGHDPATLALGRLGSWVHWLQGRPDEARRHAEACVTRAEACRHPLNRAFSLGFALLVEEFRRDADAAAQLRKSFAELVEEYGFALPYPSAYVLMSWPLAHTGETDGAVSQLREGVAMSRRTGVREGLSLLLAALAETELLRENAKEGLAAIEEARAFVQETGERIWEAEIHRFEGELRRVDGEDGPAEACFQTAIDVAAGQGALSLELRAATSLAQLWKDTGRGQEARPLLADVYSRFDEGFDTADLREAKALLDSL